MSRFESRPGGPSSMREHKPRLAYNGVPYFTPETYRAGVETAARYIQERLPQGFKPEIAITLGSGLGGLASLIDPVAEPISYVDLHKKTPLFPTTSVQGHKGNLIFGYMGEVPVVGLQGRKHYYEIGSAPDAVSAMRYITLPMYVLKQMDVKVYLGTNAVGALNPDYKRGDLMIVKSHYSLNVPNPLLGGPVGMFDVPQFVPQHDVYDGTLRELLHQAAINVGEAQNVHEGVYVAVSGPTYESEPESLALRREADAVGMSLVPEAIVGRSLKMRICGVSVITNVIHLDGSNPTSHEEVTKTLDDEQARNRAENVIRELVNLYPMLHAA